MVICHVHEGVLCSSKSSTQTQQETGDFPHLFNVQPKLGHLMRTRHSIYVVFHINSQLIINFTFVWDNQGFSS